MVLHMHLYSREVKRILRLSINLWIDVENHCEYAKQKKTFLFSSCMCQGHLSHQYPYFSGPIHSIIPHCGVNGRCKAHLAEVICMVRVYGVYPYGLCSRLSQGQNVAFILLFLILILYYI